MASPSAFPASCFKVVSDFDIRASDLCPATLPTSLVANGTPTYTTCNAANELLQEINPGVETATYSYPPVGGGFPRGIDPTEPGFTPNTFASRGPTPAGRRQLPC